MKNNLKIAIVLLLMWAMSGLLISPALAADDTAVDADEALAD